MAEPRQQVRLPILNKPGVSRFVNLISVPLGVPAIAFAGLAVLAYFRTPASPSSDKRRLVNPASRLSICQIVPLPTPLTPVSPHDETVLITGTSSGIGLAAAHHFAEQGWNVVATMRKPSCDAGNALSQLKNLLVLPLDVTDRDAIHKVVRDTIAHFGDLHVLINNAGYGLAGPMEFATPEQIDRQYKTNLYGPIFLMQAVLPHMRSKASGVIVNVTSVGGRLVLPFNSLYHGTKYALEGISESANLELAPLGIRIKLIEPGGVKTNFSGRSLVMTAPETVTAYNDMLSHARESFGKTLANSPPDLIARVLYEAATDETEKMRFPAGEDAKVMLKTRASASDEDHQKAMTQQFNLLCDKNQ